jgi:hypothetical protein
LPVFLSAGLLPLFPFFVVVLFLSVFFLTSFSLVSSFCHSFFYTFLPPFTAYFYSSFCSSPPSRNHFAVFETELMRDIKYRGQVIGTFVEVHVRYKALCIPVHYSYRQSTDVHDISGITKGDTQRPSGNELRPGSFCAGFSTLAFLKTK